MDVSLGKLSLKNTNLRMTFPPRPYPHISRVRYARSPSRIKFHSFLHFPHLLPSPDTRNHPKIVICSSEILSRFASTPNPKKPTPFVLPPLNIQDPEMRRRHFFVPLLPSPAIGRVGGDGRACVLFLALGSGGTRRRGVKVVAIVVGGGGGGQGSAGVGGVGDGRGDCVGGDGLDVGLDGGVDICRWCR